MDIQPSQPNQSQPTTPSMPPIQTPPPSNKRWEIILGVVLIVVIAGTSAWFLLGKNNAQNPQTTNTPIVQEPSTTPVNDAQQIKNYTVGDVRNAYLYRPYTYNSSNFYIADEKIALKDGVGTFSYCEGSQTCDASQTKRGAVTLSNITAPSDPSLLGDLDWGGTGGAMIMAFDFANQPKQYYLATFDLNKSDAQSPYTIYTPPIKNLGTLAGTIKNIEIVNKGEITLNIQTTSGVMSRTFSITAGRRYYDLSELTPDRTGKIYDDERFGYSFVYPNDISISSGQSMRNTQMEADLKVSPVYHAQECGLQPTFADNAVPFWSSNTTNGSVNLNANLTVHKIGTSPLYLTSALYGYDPADWGKIKQTIAIQDYINSINNGTSISGRKVTRQTIQSFTVRHIAPFSIGKPCDTQYREQYQWVSGNLLFNLIFTDSTYGAATSNALKTKLINSIFSSLKLK